MSLDEVIIIDERSSAVYRARLEDADQAAVSLAAITSIKLSLYDDRTGPPTGNTHASVINGRYQQSSNTNLTYASGSGNVTGATNAEPIVVTAASHGLSDGKIVRIKDVGGNRAANGSWKVNVLTANTFELIGSVGSGDYTSGGTWDHSLLEWSMQPADTVVKGSVLPQETENHTALFEIVYSSGEKRHEFRHQVRQVAIVT